MSNPFGPPLPGSGESPQGPNQSAPALSGANPFALDSPTENPEPPRSNKFGARWLVIIAVVVALVLAGLGAWAVFGGGESSERTSAPSAAPSPAAPPASMPSESSVPPPDVAPTDESIADLLKNVVVVEELPQLPGYERSCSPGKGCVFGPAWTDTEHTGCDTRNRVLAQQLVEVVLKPGTRNCKVVTGLLHDPYTGNDLQFGPGQSGDIQIDHVFALARAWDAGAANWPLDRRVEFANDTGNLLAVATKENMSKSDSGPGTWMPANAAFDCQYAKIYLTVAAKYSLMITRDDEAAATQACAS